MLRAGTSLIEISPGKGLELAGYPHFPRYNKGVHDPLFASCLYLENGQEKILFIAMDLLFFSKKYVSEVRKKIQEKTQIPSKNVFISVSHTHSGPWAAGRLDMEALEQGLNVDRAYIENLKDKIVRISVDAYYNTFKAVVASGSTICGKKEGIGGNRRHREGPVDPQLWTFAVKDKYDVLRSALVKYALHPTVIHENSSLVSADYPGYLRQYLRSKYQGMNLLFMQGTSGDQSTRYFRKGQDFKEAKRIGNTLGKCASNSIDRLQFEDEVKIRSISHEIKLPLKKLVSEQEALSDVEKTRKRWEMLKQKGAPYIDIQNANLKNLGSENMLGYIRLKKRGIPISLEEDEFPAEVHVVTIGNTAIVGLPGEIFVELGLDIKKDSPYQNTIVVELTNGCLPGYVCTPDAIKEGGYEVGASLLSEEAGKILVDKAVELLNLCWIYRG